MELGYDWNLVFRLMQSRIVHVKFHLDLLAGELERYIFVCRHGKPLPKLHLLLRKLLRHCAGTAALAEAGYVITSGMCPVFRLDPNSKKKKGQLRLDTLESLKSLASCFECEID